MSLRGILEMLCVPCPVCSQRVTRVTSNHPPQAILDKGHGAERPQGWAEAGALLVNPQPRGRPSALLQTCLRAKRAARGLPTRPPLPAHRPQGCSLPRPGAHVLTRPSPQDLLPQRRRRAQPVLIPPRAPPPAYQSILGCRAAWTTVRKGPLARSRTSPRPSPSSPAPRSLPGSLPHSWSRRATGSEDSP